MAKPVLDKYYHHRLILNFIRNWAYQTKGYTYWESQGK